MKRFIGITLGAVLAIGLASTVTLATPNPNSAVIFERVFNDCPASTLTTLNNYPSTIWIDDLGASCYGWANLHVWRLSEDGVNPAVFNNGDAFRFGADLIISGTGEGEAGLNISPWWSQNVDGRFMVKSVDGEIACWGGRLPFYSFTVAYGLHYVKGTTIHLEITYLPNDLNQANPATIEYKLTYNSTEYSSGPLPFDEGNPNEPYGTWGMLDDARVGGYVQVLWQFAAPDAELRATWNNHTFENLTPPVPVEQGSWGRIKNLYR